MSQQDFWCDHCQNRFATVLAAPSAVVTCPKCAESTAVVTCQSCGEQSEIAQPNQTTQRWVCPSCKEGQQLDDALIIDVISAEINVVDQAQHPPAQSNKQLADTLKLLVVASLLLFVWYVDYSRGTPTNRNAPALRTSTPAPTSVPRLVDAPLDEILSIQEWAFAAKPQLHHFGKLAFIATEDRVGHLYMFNLALLRLEQIQPIYRESRTFSPLVWKTGGRGMYATYGNSLRFLYESGNMATVMGFDISAEAVPTLRLSRDGEQILYIDDGQLLRGEKGDEEQGMTSVELVDVQSADFSPDGKQIAYVKGTKLHIHTISSGEQTGVTLSENMFFRAKRLKWSPDGGKVALLHRGSRSLMIIDLETNLPKQLSLRGSVSGYDWAPDGDYLVVTELSYGRQTLALIDVAFGSTMPLLETTTHELRDPIWVTDD